MGLKQSEIEAIKVLAGQMPSVQGTAVSAEFAYASLLERASQFLGAITQEPEFPEVCSFVATMGAEGAPWIPELVLFANTFVNSQAVHLRLQTLAVVNKMPTFAPRSKLAVLFRSYRKKPDKNGMCAVAEPDWAKEGNAKDILCLEELLYYWWRTCEDALSKLPGNAGHVLRINAAIRAAEALARMWENNRKKKVPKQPSESDRATVARHARVRYGAAGASYASCAGELAVLLRSCGGRGQGGGTTRALARHRR